MTTEDKLAFALRALRFIAHPHETMESLGVSTSYVIDDDLHVVLAMNTQFLAGLAKETLICLEESYD